MCSRNKPKYTHIQQNDESAADWRKTIQDSLAEFNAIKLNSPSDSTPFYFSLSLSSCVWRCYYHNPDHFCFFCCCWLFFFASALTFVCTHNVYILMRIFNSIFPVRFNFNALKFNIPLKLSHFISHTQRVKIFKLIRMPNRIGSPFFFTTASFLF